MVNFGAESDKSLQEELLNREGLFEVDAVLKNRDGSELSSNQVRLQTKIEENWLNVDILKVNLVSSIFSQIRALKPLSILN